MTKASRTYDERQGQVIEKLGKIVEALKAHQDQANQHTSPWGYAGDLDCVDSKLDEIIRFLGVTDTIPTPSGKAADVGAHWDTSRPSPDGLPF